MEDEGNIYEEVGRGDPSPTNSNALRDNTNGGRDDNDMMPLSKKPKLSTAPASDDDSVTALTKKCDSCQQDYAKSLYTKKQWNKVYGGWICNNCLEEERQQNIQKQRLQIKQEKQNCHDQKIADQKAKSSGTFHLQKRCFTCQHTLDRTQYSGKQWKQLYRQCISCISKQQEELRSQPKSKRKVALKKPPFPKPASATSTGEDIQNQKQLCSSCEENKVRDLFSAKQWKFANDEERMCKDCWSEEELAKEQHRYEEQEEKEKRQQDASAQQEVRKRCFACHEFKSLKREFSGKQSKKSYGICSTCVTILQEERRNRGGGGASGGVSDDTIRKVCSNCHLEKSQNEFGRQQWKSKKGVHRKCRACALTHVKETEEHRQAEKEAREREDEQAGNDQIVDTSSKKQTSSDMNNTYPLKSRRCFGCKQLKSNDNFSLRQVTRTYPICKGCSPSSTLSEGGGSAATTMEREGASSQKEKVEEKNEVSTAA